MVRGLNIHLSDTPHSRTKIRNNLANHCVSGQNSAGSCTATERKMERRELATLIEGGKDDLRGKTGGCPISKLRGGKRGAFIASKGEKEQAVLLVGLLQVGGNIAVERPPQRHDHRAAATQQNIQYGTLDGRMKSTDDHTICLDHLMRPALRQCEGLGRCRARGEEGHERAVQQRAISG